MYGVAGGYGYLGHRKGRFPSSNDISSGSTFYNEHGNVFSETITLNDNSVMKVIRNKVTDVIFDASVCTV